MALADLNVRLGLITKQFEQNLNSVDRKLRKFQRNIEGIGKNLTAGITAPLAAVGAGATKVFTDFEFAIAKVQAVSGATGKSFDALRESALELGRTTQFTASEVANLQLNLSKLGFAPEEINQSTAAILDLALATGEDLAESAGVAASTLRGFGLDATEMIRVTNVMADSFSSTALDLKKFQTSMAIVAPVANQAGASIEETTAVLGALINRGVDASSAGSALRNIFLDLADKGFTWEEAMVKVRDSVNPLATSMELFGKRGATVATIIANNREEISGLTADFIDSEGEARKMAAIMEDTLFGALNRLKSAVEGAGISLGAVMAPAIASIADRLNAAVTRFNELDDSTKKIIVRIAGIAAAVGPTLLIMGKLVAATRTLNAGFGLIVSASTLLPKALIALASPTATLTAAFGLLTKGLTVLKTSFLAFFTNPVGIAIAAAAALVAGFVALYRNSETFRVGLSALGKTLKNTFESSFGTVESIISGFTAAVSAVASSITALINLVISKVQDFAERYREQINAVGRFLRTLFDINVTIFDGITRVVGGFVSGVVGIFRRLFDIIAETATKFKEGFEAIKDGDIGGALKLFGQGLIKSNPVGLFLTEGRNLASGFTEGFQKGFENFSVKKVAQNFNFEFQKQLEATKQSVEVTQDVTVKTKITEEIENPTSGLDATGISGGSEERQILGQAALSKAAAEAGILSTALNGVDKNVKEVIKTISGINDALAAVNTKKTLLGANFAEDTEKIKVLRKGIEDLAELGVSVENESLQGFVSQLNELTEQPKVIDLELNVPDSEVLADLDLSVPEIDEIGNQLAAQNSYIEQYRNQLQLATDSARVFGQEGGELLGTRLQFTQQALQNAINEFGPYSAVVAGLKEQYQALNEQVLASNNEVERQAALQASAATAIDAFGSSLESSIAAAESFGRAIKAALLNAIDAIIKFGVAEIIKGTLSKSSFLGPLAIPIAAAAGAATSALFKRTVGLAEGGIIPPGFPNDTFPARLSSGEAVIPLDRLGSLTGIGSGNVQLGGEFVLRGDDMFLLVRNAEERFNRFS